jgi:membrane-bound lytic murein transglycosylase A
MRVTFLWLGALLALALSVFIAIWTLPERPARLGFSAVGYDRLEGWREADLALTAQAFERSCTRIMKTDAGRAMGGESLFGTVGDWQPACRDFLALDLSAIDSETLRTFFETRFQPLSVTAEAGPMGLFTGYYEPEYPGSLEKAPDYPVPLYARPADLVTVNLGAFSEALKGKRVVGRVRAGALVPYPDRKEIEENGLKTETRAVAWLKDPVDAFFLHIQGSGVVLLADGTRYRVGYAAQNGRDYTAIGRVLRQMGALAPDNISMQTIRQWLEDHPDKAAAVMQENQSFIFFRPVTGEGPIGSEGVPLTAGHSLAVDRSVFPMGAPIWLQTQAPLTADSVAPLHRLMIAQDTGGAIDGAIRGDVFWGTGEAAGEIAGRMQAQGRYFVLVPDAVAARLEE